MVSKTQKFAPFYKKIMELWTRVLDRISYSKTFLYLKVIYLNHYDLNMTIDSVVNFM